MALIFYLSSMSEPLESLPDVDWGPIDKVYHLVEYAVLGFLLARAIVYTSPRFFPASTWIIALSIAGVYGASDEWHQSFVPGRYPTVSDWIVDAVGSALGVLIVYLHRR